MGKEESERKGSTASTVETYQRMRPTKNLKKATAQAYEAYEKARAQAYEAYEKATAQAYEAYKKARAQEK